jgi:hypothetical protein
MPKTKVARSVKSCGRSCETQSCGYAERELEYLVKVRLEAQNWAIALELYERHPIDALLLAQQLMAIKQCLQRGRKGISDAIAGLELAIDALFPHTDFHSVSHRFYLRRLEGTLKPNEEEKLRQLGIGL